MPPKKKKKAGAKDKKKKDQAPKKIKIDKTFGMKNKKGKKAQNQIRQMQMAEANRGKSRAMLKKEEERKKLKLQKKQKASMDAEMKSLFTAVVKKTVVPKGVDPKSVICEAYKKGQCKRGKKCRYSHDFEKVRKVAKIDLYSDPRQLDTMDKWDQSKLEDVVNQKYEKRANETKIVCKYFLKAIEKKKYGWFWECPNGETCIYQHKLPPGYVLKTTITRKKVDGKTLGQRIEEQRKKLDPTKLTPVTPETFSIWKKKQQNQKKKQIEEQKKVIAKKSGGRAMMSGKALFDFNPDLFEDDEDAVSEKDFESDNEEKKGDDDVNTLATQINEDLFMDDEELPDSDDD